MDEANTRLRCRRRAVIRQQRRSESAIADAARRGHRVVLTRGQSKFLIDHNLRRIGAGDTDLHRARSTQDFKIVRNHGERHVIQDSLAFEPHVHIRSIRRKMSDANVRHAGGRALIDLNLRAESIVAE